MNIVVPSDRKGWYTIRPERLSDHRCAECGRVLTENEGTLCDNCEGEAFAEDEWIEEDY